MKTYFNNVYKNNSDLFEIGIFMLLIVAIFCLFSSCIDYNDRQKKKEEEQAKSTMTEEEKVKYDASQKFCTRTTGSRPSCWSDTDWDLFFIKYCERLPKQCE